MYRASTYYEQLDCMGTYDTLTEIGKRKREFVYREAEFKLRSIILRTCTCEVISHLYRNKLDVAERGGRGPGAEPLSRGFSAAPQAGKERFLCLFEIKQLKTF